MRLGLLADVHANLAALDVALDFLHGEAVDAYACAGDLVGYGPQPNECVARVAALPGVCVAGNHDLIALGELSPERCIPLARKSLEWTRRVLGEEERAVLRALPRSAEAPGGVLVAHGSVGDPQEYVFTTESARAQLAAAPEAEIVLLGHTHRPLAVGEHGGELLIGGGASVVLEPGDRHVLNPGSVGQSRERRPCVRVAVLDLDSRRVAFHALRYDARACRAELRRRGLPPRSCHLKPRPWARTAWP